MSGLIGIAVEEAKHAIEALGTPNVSLMTALAVAMRTTKHHWLVTNDEDRFKAALAAAGLFFGMGSLEFARIKKETDIIRKFSAIVAGAEAGLVFDINSLPDSDPDFEPIGLVKMWMETP